MLHKHQFVIANPDIRHIGTPGITYVCIDPACQEVRDVFAREIRRPKIYPNVGVGNTTSATHPVDVETGQVFIIKEGLPERE